MNLFERNKPLFYTHTMYNLKPGDIHCDPFKKKKYLISKVKRESNTALSGGGSAPCWAVYGKEISGE